MDRGVVFGIQHFSINDGPGIRTAVFLKGCNLRCAWCHNPESLDWRTEVSVADQRCVGCGLCAQACPQGLHRAEGGAIAHLHAPGRCTGCGACEAACPVGAIRLMGKPMTVEEALSKVERDRRYYGAEGGMTVTGGEPTVQFDFLLALAKASKARGIGVYIETNGTAPRDRYEALLPFLDGLLIDYKLTDSDAHRRWTGVGNEGILENIGWLAETGKVFALRCPIIPGVNDDDAHFRAIAELTRRHPKIRGAEVMPYHRLGISKARQIGWDAARIRAFEAPSPEQTESWKARILALGGRIV